MQKGYELFKNESVDCSRDFGIGRPLLLESELGFPNHVPAFWSCADKMMTSLLFQAWNPDGHGIRPRSLKVATISTLMTEVAKGRENLSRLAIQGQYRAATAQDMAVVYSRNLAQRQIFFSKFAQQAFSGKQRIRVYLGAPIGISGRMSTR